MHRLAKTYSEDLLFVLRGRSPSMNRRTIWCFGLCLSGLLACERYAGGEANQEEKAESAPAAAVPQDEPVEEMPARAEDVGDESADARTNSPQNQSLRVLKMLQNDVADLERNVLALETKMNAAPSSEVLLDKLKSVQTLVQDAKNRVSALEDVRNLPKYENELDTARDALRTARHAVDNFRTELKKNLEETGAGLPQKQKAGQMTP